MPTVQWLAGHRGRIEHKLWTRWMEEVAETRELFSQKISDDPFLYNETASVGVLATAAARADLVSMAEYVATKRLQTDRRRKVLGRCDLWLYSPGHRRSWAVEFKQMYCLRGVRETTLRKALDRAVSDAKCVDSWEADARFGALLVAPQDGVEVDEKLGGVLTKFAEQTDNAWRVEGGSRPIYLFFKQA